METNKVGDGENVNTPMYSCSFRVTDASYTTTGYLS